MRIRWVLVGVVALVLAGSVTVAVAQQDLQGGIQDLVKQMISSMEQQQKRKLAILDFTKLDGSADNLGRCMAQDLCRDVRSS